MQLTAFDLPWPLSAAVRSSFLLFDRSEPRWDRAPRDRRPDRRRVARIDPHVRANLLHSRTLEIFQGLVKKGEVVGIDFVEVAPDYDQSGSTAFLAAQFLMNVLGFIFHEKGMSA